MRRAGVTTRAQAAANSVGFAPSYEPPVPIITDTQLRRDVLSRAPSDPHVDIVVMYRAGCGHCKPELARVANYTNTHENTAGFAVEIDRTPDAELLREMLLDEDWSSPATGYFRGGKLRLSSPSRREPVDRWVAESRAALD